MLEQRTRAADRHFAFTEATVAGAIELCRHLDGIPLAIEMAAARLPVLGLEVLSGRLRDRLRLLRGRSRSAPVRQQTLRATLDWSHSLLSVDEQAVLRRLSVFVGSFRLDIGQRVAASADLDERTVIDALTALVDESLVQVERLEPPRYRLLETTRLYAAERLAEGGETVVTLQRHGPAMALLGEESMQAFWVSADRPWHTRYQSDYDDLQMALERACEVKDPEVVAATCEVPEKLSWGSSFARGHKEAAYAMLPWAGPLARARLGVGLSPFGRHQSTAYRD